MQTPLRSHRIFLVIGLVGGAVFLGVTPPFQAPDEPFHFYRAYSVSEGKLLAVNRSGRTGDLLPVSLLRLNELYYDVPGRTERRIAPGTLAKARQLELEPERRTFLDYPSSAVYSPLPYVPQALAVAMGRAAGAKPLTLLYLARLFNLACATALICFALRLLPAYGWLSTLIVLSPMAVFLRASASADALTTAFALLLVALVARLAWPPATRQPVRCTWRDVALLTAASMAVCLTKVPYAPLALTVFLIPADRWPQARRIPAVLVVLAASGIAVLGALATAWSVDASLRADSGVDSKAQVAAALNEPVRFLGIVAEDYLRNSPRYVAELIGRLGWLDTPLPLLLLGTFVLVALGLLATDTSTATVEPWQRGGLILLAAGTLLLISGSQYAIWTPLGAAHIEGTQGRHFYPVAFLFPWICHPRRWTNRLSEARRGLVVASFSVASLATAAVVVATRY